MSTSLHPAAATLPHTLHPIRRPWTAWWRAWRQRVRRTRFERIEPIDAATLRDLGLHRSELGSYRAEAEGRVEATRLRVLRQCLAAER